MLIELLELLDLINNGIPHALIIHFLIFIIGAYSLRRYISTKYKSKTILTINDSNDISVIVPAYHEKPNKFERVLRMIYENNPKEIIVALDDPSEDDKQIAKKYAKTVFCDGKGKLGAMLKALQYVDPKTEYIAFIDSDTEIPNKNGLVELLNYFHSKDIVGIMPAHSVSNTNSISGSLTNIDENSRNVIEKGLSMYGYLSVVDGRCMIWRKNFIFDIKDELAKLEEKVGDDAGITYLAYKNGYKTAYADAIIVVSPQITLFKYFKQQIRWARTGYYYLFKYLKSNIPFISKIHQLLYYIEPYSLILSIILDLTVFSSNLLNINPLLIPLIIISGLVMNSIITQTILFNRVLSIKYLIPVAIIGLCIMMPIKIYASLTMNKHKQNPTKQWLTR
jgi:cellulose synthase/poly-beta-1,6-N-acetylglucosamine synthase-like glycosyltransferase